MFTFSDNPRAFDFLQKRLSPAISLVQSDLRKTYGANEVLRLYSGQRMYGEIVTFVPVIGLADRHYPDNDPIIIADGVDATVSIARTLQMCLIEVDQREWPYCPIHRREMLDAAVENSVNGHWWCGKGHIAALIGRLEG